MLENPSCFSKFGAAHSFPTPPTLFLFLGIFSKMHVELSRSPCSAPSGGGLSQGLRSSSRSKLPSFPNGLLSSAPRPRAGHAHFQVATWDE